MNDIEKRIISGIIDRALALGYSISVFDSVEWAVSRSRNKAEILAETGATDETTYKFRSIDGEVVGRIYFIHGNDEDVVSDCSDKPEILDLIS